VTNEYLYLCAAIKNNAGLNKVRLFCDSDFVYRHCVLINNSDLWNLRQSKNAKCTIRMHTKEGGAKNRCNIINMVGFRAACDGKWFCGYAQNGGRLNKIYK